MHSRTLAATWGERLKSGLRMAAILAGVYLIPFSVKTAYTGQGSIRDIVSAWLIVAPIAALGGFIMPVGEGPFTPPTTAKRRTLALITAAAGGIGAAMLELLITFDTTTDKLGAAVTTAILVAVWMGIAEFVLAPGTPARPPISIARQRQNV
jgi:hypothetical protein